MTKRATVPPSWGHDEMVPLDRIKIPPFQRGEKTGHIKKIADNFSPAPFGRPTFWLNDGWYFCLDGQQRCAAATLRGLKAVPGTVLDDLSYAEAARVYTLINRDRKNMTPLEKFVGALEAGGEGEKEIAQILHEFGLDKGRSNPIVAIQEVHNDGNLRTIYELINATWGCDFPNATERPMLIGLNCWLKRRAANGGYDPEKAAKKLRRADPANIQILARRRLGSTGNGLAAAVADEIERLMRKRG